jgi:hypothetical protein
MDKIFGKEIASHLSTPFMSMLQTWTLLIKAVIAIFCITGSDYTKCTGIVTG